MKILIADDHPTNLKLLKAILEGEGHVILDAGDGAEALSILQTEPVDAIISDILMPNMDGYRLCFEVRQSEKLRSIPFITYSSTYTSAADEKAAFAAGSDMYIRRPAPLETFVSALHEFATDPKYRHPRRGAIVDDLVTMKSYSQALVAKLEERNQRLEIAQAEISRINQELEQRVAERTAELEAANQELEAFSYSAAHDLRAPLRAIGSLCYSIIDEHEGELSSDAQNSVQRIRGLAAKMNDLIGQLLSLSNIVHCDLARQSVDLSALAQMVLKELYQAEPDRQMRMSVDPGIEVEGDISLFTIVLQNLLGNAWKFTAKTEHPQIEFRRSNATQGATCFVRDNGAGFDMAYADNLFGPFRRMHSQHEFPGTGLGLTIVQRIVSRHGGRIWAESAPGVGTTFFLAL